MSTIYLQANAHALMLPWFMHVEVSDIHPHGKPLSYASISFRFNNHALMNNVAAS